MDRERDNDSGVSTSSDKLEAARSALDQLRPSPERAVRESAVEGPSWLGLLMRRFGLPSGVTNAHLEAVVVCVAVGIVAAVGGWFAAGWIGEASNRGDDVSQQIAGRVDHSLPLSPRVTGVPGTTGHGGTAPAGPLAAHAAGAVMSPGLYTVPGGSRVADLVRAAGGFAPDADPDRVNLAAPVRDGMRLYVPRRGEQQVPPAVTGDEATGGTGSGAGSDGSAGAGGSGSGKQPSGRVDINRASVVELDALPGIGPTIAAAIVEYRIRNGPFLSVDDLRKVSGIGDAKLRELRDWVTVGG